MATKKLKSSSDIFYLNFPDCGQRTQANNERLIQRSELGIATLE
jgi:hypothetical protein